MSRASFKSYFCEDMQYGFWFSNIRMHFLFYFFMVFYFFNSAPPAVRPRFSWLMHRLKITFCVDLQYGFRFPNFRLKCCYSIFYSFVRSTASLNMERLSCLMRHKNSFIAFLMIFNSWLLFTLVFTVVIQLFHHWIEQEIRLKRKFVS